MVDLLSKIDFVAEKLERRGHVGLAAVLDRVAQEVEERKEFRCPHGECADGECADAEGKCTDGSVATASAQPGHVLADSAPALYRATQRYGVSSYNVQPGGVKLRIDRGGIHTEAYLSMARAEKPCLLVRFVSGSEHMDREAELASATPAAIVKAVEHVFSTGENYKERTATPSGFRVQANLQAQHFYVADGFDHFWPLPSGWDIVDMGDVDLFGSTTSVSYQYIGKAKINSELVGLPIVEFNGDYIALQKGSGKWNYKLGGKRYSGTFSSEADVPKTLGKILTQMSKKRKELMAQAIKQLSVGDWDVFSLTDDITMSVDLSTDYGVTVVVYDGTDLACGLPVSAEATLSDTGGYASSELLYDQAEVNSLPALKRFANKFLKQAKEHLTGRI